MHETSRTVEITSLSMVPLRGVDLVLLDLDNTLYDYEPCHAKALEVIVGKISAHFSMDQEGINTLYMECRKMVHTRNHGTAVSHSRLFYLQAMIEKLAHRTNIDLISALYQVYWETFIHAMVLFPDAKHFLESCLSERISMVLVTDMTAEIQFQKICKLDIAKYLQFIVTSEEAGVEKPNPFIFELAIQKTKAMTEVKKILVIGDDQQKDCFESILYDIGMYHLNRK